MLRDWRNGPIKSILQSVKECWAWRRYADLQAVGELHEHHIFGGPLRVVSEKHGFKVWLTAANHTGNNPQDNPLGIRGVHFNKDMARELKQLCQTKYEETHTRAEWLALIGRNYRED